MPSTTDLVGSAGGLRGLEDTGLKKAHMESQLDFHQGGEFQSDSSGVDDFVNFKKGPV